MVTTTRPSGGPRLTPAGERLLAAASELFYARGIRAVGVDLIAEEAGTTKKTLYDRFGSKDALAALYLQRRAERWTAFVARYLDEHAMPAGPDRVVAVFDALEAWMSNDYRGCAFVNAYAEIGGSDHPGVAVIRADKESMRALFEELVAEAGVPEAADVGAQIHLLYEGANVALTAGGLPDAFDQAKRAARRLLG